MGRDDLAQHWTLSGNEHALLANKTGATRLAFAVLLKAFQSDGRFPERREDVPHPIVTHLAQQVGVLPDVYAEVDWTGRSSRRHRGHTLHYGGICAFRAEDEPTLVDWLTERVVTLDPQAEAFKGAAYAHLRRLHVEPLHPSACAACCGPPCDNAKSASAWTRASSLPPGPGTRSTR